MTGWHFSIAEKRSLFYIHFSLSCDHLLSCWSSNVEKKTGLSLFSKVHTSKWCILSRGEFIWDIRQLETSTLLILYSAAGSFVSCVGWIWISVTRVAAWALTQGDHLLQFWWNADVSALLPMSERCLRLYRANCFSHQMAKTPVGSSSGCRIICIRNIILCINDTLAHQWQSRTLSPHPPPSHQRCGSNGVLLHLSAADGEQPSGNSDQFLTCLGVSPVPQEGFCWTLLDLNTSKFLMWKWILMWNSQSPPLFTLTCLITLKIHHRRLWPQVWRGGRGEGIYPLTQIFIHQAVSEGVNHHAARPRSAPQGGGWGVSSWCHPVDSLVFKSSIFCLSSPLGQYSNKYQFTADLRFSSP